MLVDRIFNVEKDLPADSCCLRGKDETDYPLSGNRKGFCRL